MNQNVVHKVSFSFLVLIMVTAPAAPLYPQTPSISEAGAEAVRSLTSVAEMLIAESFTPMSGYDAGDIWIIASPAIFQVLQLHQEPLVEGQEMTGISFGAGGGYALSNRLMLYLIGAGMSMQGGLSFAPYEGIDTTVNSDAEYSLISLNGGIGFEVIDRDWISVPLFFGPHLQYYSVEIIPSPITVEMAGTYTVTSEISGSGMLTGISGGVAAYMKFFGRFALTPYLIGMGSFKQPGFTGEVTLDTGIASPQTLENSYSVDPVWGVMFGLDLGFHGKTGWSVSLALGDLLGMLIGTGSTMAGEGVVIRPAVVTATLRL